MEILNLLETIIGLVLVYLVLSLVCSSIVEGWMQWRGVRGSILFKGLKQMLGNSDDLANSLFDHPEMRTMASLNKKDSSIKRHPSYLNSKRVARALIGMVTNDNVDRLKNLPTVLYSKLDRDAIEDGIRKRVKEWKAHSEKSGQNFIADSDLGCAADRLAPILQNLWQRAEGVPERFIGEVELWFDEVNDRARGWLKRSVGWKLILVGFLVALISNADTVQIFSRLSQDPALREVVVKQAESQLKRLDEGISQNSDSLQTLLHDEAKRGLSDLQPLLGWQTNDPLLQCIRDCPVGVDDPGRVGYTLKFFGLLITAFALSMGAPFWFDLLRKLLEVRGKLTSKDEPQKEESEKQTPPPGGGVSGSDLAAALEDKPLPATNPDAERFVAGLKGFAPFLNAADRMNAYWLARVAQLAYRNDKLDNDEAAWRERVVRTCRAWQLDNCQTFDKTVNFNGIKVKAIDTQCFAGIGREIIVVGFRGTEPTKIEDVVTDLRFKQLDPPWLPPGIGAKVHQGFAEALDAVWGELFQFIKDHSTTPRRIFFAGHSLGGALAALAAVRYTVEAARLATQQANEIPEISNKIDEAETGEQQVLKDKLAALRTTQFPRFGGLYTLGQPRFANDALTTWVDSCFGESYVRSVNNRDAVPRVPLLTMGYHHAGQLFYFDELGRFYPNPSFFLRTLDILNIDPEDPKSAVKEAAGDHDVNYYVDLLANTARINIDHTDIVV